MPEYGDFKVGLTSTLHHCLLQPMKTNTDVQNPPYRRHNRRCTERNLLHLVWKRAIPERILKTRSINKTNKVHAETEIVFWFAFHIFTHRRPINIFWFKCHTRWLQNKISNSCRYISVQLNRPGVNHLVRKLKPRSMYCVTHTHFEILFGAGLLF